MLAQVIVAPQMVRASSPRGDNCLAKCSLSMEVEHAHLDDVEPVIDRGERERLGEVKELKTR